MWIKIISGIISNINNVQDEGGWELESLLDNYLDRAATQPAPMPSFLQDEALLIDHEDVSLTRRTRGEVSLGSFVISTKKRGHERWLSCRAIKIIIEQGLKLPAAFILNIIDV